MIGFEITRYDGAGLQNVIEFGLQSATNILKNGLQSQMGLQSVTDYKAIQFNSSNNFKTALRYASSVFNEVYKLYC